MTDLVRQNRGKIVNEIYVPLNAREADFSRTIQEIKKTSPDVIFSTVVGAGTAAFYQAYRAAGFDPARQPIASLTTSEAEVAEWRPRRRKVTSLPRRSSKRSARQPRAAS